MLRGLQGWHLIILVAVVVLLFGAKRLPDAARGIGRSLRIFKSEVKEMQAEDVRSGTTIPKPEPLEGRVIDEQPGRAPSEQRHDA
jgi:sec-independent protein translocase protein TatA